MEQSEGGHYAEMASQLTYGGTASIDRIMAYALISLALNLDRIANLMEFHILPSGMKGNDD